MPPAESPMTTESQADVTSLSLSAAVARQLRGELAMRNMPAYRVAEQAGLTQATFARRLRGERDGFTLDELEAVCRVLGVEPATLVERARTASADPASV